MKKTSAFTFVEVMLVASIFAIVAVAIYSTLGAGISAWKKSQEAQTLHQDARLTLNKMAQDLENASLYSKKEGFSNFSGEKNKISFYSLVDDYQALPVHPELKRITYSLNEPAHTLLRQEETFPESVQETPSQAPEAIALQVANLNFFYCYEDKAAEPPYKWLDSWQPNPAKDIFLPQGVKIELKLDAKGKLSFTKYVFIPTGEKGKE